MKFNLELLPSPPLAVFAPQDNPELNLSFLDHKGFKQTNYCLSQGNFVLISFISGDKENIIILKQTLKKSF
jgi:hypothetical protein